jgi:hypothetical protein
MPSQAVFRFNVRRIGENGMSDITAIVLILALFLLAFVTAAFLLRHMYKRCDDILSGVVNGIPVSVRSRWLFFLHDYVALSFAVTIIAGVTGVGFVTAAEALGDSNAAVFAQVCAVPAAGFFVFNLLLGLIWMRHFATILRQAEAD